MASATSSAHILVFWWSYGRVRPWRGVVFLDRITPYVETRVDAHSPHPLTGVSPADLFLVHEVRCFALVGRIVRSSHRGAEQRRSLVGMAAGADRGCGVRSAVLWCKARGVIHILGRGAQGIPIREAR